MMVGRHGLVVAALLTGLIGCGADPSDAPVPWTGEAVNSLNGDDDAPVPDICRLDATGGCDAPDTPSDPAPETPPDDNQSPPETEPPPPPPPPDPDGWPAGWSGAENEMLVLVNQFRTAGGACPSGTYGPRAPLAMNADLRSAARHHSEDMADNNYFSHTSQDGRSPWQRIGDAGYDGQPAAENIAAGNQTAAATFEQWRNSDGHCRNMMTTNANEIGIGYAEGGGYGSYWTQTFGAR